MRSQSLSARQSNVRGDAGTPQRPAHVMISLNARRGIAWRLLFFILPTFPPHSNHPHLLGPAAVVASRMLLKPTSSAPEPLQTTTKFNVYTEDSVQLQTTPSKPSLASSAHDSRHEEHMSLSIPTVRLDTQNISSAMASRLATSVLCHVLFLKGQIPL